MPRQFKLARQMNKLKATEAAERLGVSQPTLSAWEGERKSPGLDNLENMADLYGITTGFLPWITHFTLPVKSFITAAIIPEGAAHPLLNPLCLSV